MYFIDQEDKLNALNTSRNDQLAKPDTIGEGIITKSKSKEYIHIK